MLIPLLFAYITLITNVYAFEKINDILILTSDDTKLPETHLSNIHSTGLISIESSRKLSDRIHCTNSSLDNECSKNFLNHQLKYFQNPIRIIGRRISHDLSPLDVLALTQNIKRAYATNANKKLSLILIIANAPSLSILRAFLQVNIDFKIPIVVVNTDKYANLIDTQEVKVINGQLNNFCQLTPTVNVLFESISCLKQAHNLENIVFYGTNPQELSVLKEYKSIKETNDLNELLTSFKDRHFKNIERFLESTNDLLVVKSDRSRLNQLLCFYSQLRERYYPEDLRANDDEQLRFLIWIPEHESEQGIVFSQLMVKYYFYNDSL